MHHSVPFILFRLVQPKNILTALVKLLENDPINSTSSNNINSIGAPLAPSDEKLEILFPAVLKSNQFVELEAEDKDVCLPVRVTEVRF